jgi:TolA-binding protein
MLRRSCFVIFLLLIAALSVNAQNQPSSTQDVPVIQTPSTPKAESEQPAKGKDEDQQKNDQQKPSKVKRKLRGAVPDCVSIIFSKCWHNDAREQEAAEKKAELRAHAAERCKAIDAARALRTPLAPKPVSDPNESSSKASQPAGINPASCTPEDVLEAEHDVDVGDTYVETKSFKAAEMRYRDALKALPDDPVASLRLAKLLQKQGRNQEALELYRSYMSWSPTGKEADEANEAMTKLGSNR